MTGPRIVVAADAPDLDVPSDVLTRTVKEVAKALSAGFDVQAAINHDVPPPISDSSYPGLGLSHLAQARLMRAASSGYQSALASMVPWRPITSTLLAVASGLVFFMAMRLRLSPEGRAEAALLLGRASLAAAVLRSIDGAENLVIVRTMMDLVGKAVVLEGVPEAQAASEVGSVLGSLMSGGWTLVMVAAFVTLGNYFRSETLRSALERSA